MKTGVAVVAVCFDAVDEYVLNNFTAALDQPVCTAEMFVVIFNGIGIQIRFQFCRIDDNKVSSFSYGNSSCIDAKEICGFACDAMDSSFNRHLLRMTHSLFQ